MSCVPVTKALFSAISLQCTNPLLWHIRSQQSPVHLSRIIAMTLFASHLKWLLSNSYQVTWKDSNSPSHSSQKELEFQGVWEPYLDKGSINYVRQLACLFQQISCQDSTDELLLRIPVYPYKVSLSHLPVGSCIKCDILVLSNPDMRNYYEWKYWQQQQQQQKWQSSSSSSSA